MGLLTHDFFSDGKCILLFYTKVHDVWAHIFRTTVWRNARATGIFDHLGTIISTNHKTALRFQMVFLWLVRIVWTISVALAFRQTVEILFRSEMFSAYVIQSKSISYWKIKQSRLLLTTRISMSSASLRVLIVIHWYYFNFSGRN